jgi:curved DNA-binding protein CbpA
MHPNPLQTLVHLVATEENPHQLILRVAADTVLLREAQRLCRRMPGAETAPDGHVTACCRSFEILPDYFLERLQMIARIINLLPYEQNYYEILGIDRSASQQQIRQAFRRLSFSFHPDINPNDPHAAERFRNIQHSYEVLSNDMLRQSYDQNLAKQVWNEAGLSSEDAFRPTWWQRWRRTWPFGLLFVLLVLVTLVIDGRQRQTEYYHAETPASPEMLFTTQPAMEPKEAIAEDVDREIREFLSRYTSAYEAKDSHSLLRFFEADAIENGRPIIELIPFYEANFQRAKKVRYRIEVARWEVREGEVMVDGSFSLSIQSRHEAPVESTGSIHILLNRRGSDFGVKRLNYSIIESRRALE